MEFVSSNPENYFSEKEINMIKTFLENITSLFEIDLKELEKV